MTFEPKNPIDFSSRDPFQGVDKLFHERWSPRSFEKKEIPYEVLCKIFDAARWSPSCANEQPWLFVTSSNQKEFEVCLDLLEEGNRRWAVNASVIGFVFGKKTFIRNGKINTYSSFDCGAACMAIALQAKMLGLEVHMMAGIQKEKVNAPLKVSKEEYETVCGFTIGFLDTPDKLPDDLAAREVPQARKPLSEIWKYGL